jgi:hypothetical protein
MTDDSFVSVPLKVTTEVTIEYSYPPFANMKHLTLAALGAHKEQQKADFMEHMYQCSGRQNGLYTGLWKEFALNEAALYCREMYFEKLEAIKEYEVQLLLEKEAQLKEAEDFKCQTNQSPEQFLPNFHD